MGGTAPPIPCGSPSQVGCALCCEEARGPAGEMLCYRRSQAEPDPHSREGVREGYGQGELFRQGACPAGCPFCALCTVDQKREYDGLLREGCDCTDPQVRHFMAQGDPCFGYGCPCTCEQLRRLADCAASR